MIRSGDDVTCLFQVFGSMDELLRKAPMVYSTVSRSRAELHRLWQEWQAECVHRKNTPEFVGVKELQTLAEVSLPPCNYMSYLH